MTPHPPRRGVGPIRVASLVALVCCGWAAAYDKWTPRSFLRPIDYWRDAMFNLGVIKSAADFKFLPLVSKDNDLLGAPFVASWNDFPISEDHVYFLTGMLARLMGPIAALNVAFLVAAVAAALCFYFVARRLRARWELAMVGAALFALSPYLFFRNVQHFNLLFYWHVPLFVLVWLALGGGTVRANERRFIPLAVIALIAGIHNNYYFNYFLLGTGLCALALLTRRRYAQAAAAAALTGVACVGFVVTNLESIHYQASRGPNADAMQRRPVELEMYALKPIELFTPGPKHRNQHLAAAGRRYRSGVLNSGEFPGSYLGVVGAVAFVWMLAHTLRAVSAGRRTAGSQLGVISVWLVLAAVVGGFLAIAQRATGVIVWRSNNRVSIVLLCAALLFLARHATALSRRRRVSPAFVALVAAAVLVLGWWDQSPSRRIDGNAPLWEKEPQYARQAESDAKLVAQLEAAVPAGTRVFQLPPMRFVGHTIEDVPDFDHFRPYLHARTLRFSYGHQGGRPEVQWQFGVAAMPIERMVRTLEADGFGALYIHRGGYEANQVDDMVARLAAMGRGTVLHGEFGDTIVVLLEPR